MKITFLIDNMKFSGGRKLFFEYASKLENRGYKVQILTLSNKGELNTFIKSKLVDNFSSETIPVSDILLVTTPGEVESAVKSKKGKVIHFCQGFEIEDLENRIYNNILPLRYQKFLKQGFLGKIKLFRKKQYWKKKIAYYEKIYNLNTILVTVSNHLKDKLEKKYNKNVFLCKNGIHTDIFHPPQNWKFQEFSQENPCQIISIGSIKVTFKGIQDTLQAISKAKNDKLPIKFIRVAPQNDEITSAEKHLTDEYYTALPPEELGKLLKSCNVYISNSHEGEGFGLPAMEALGCGLISILNNISSYRNFSNEKDFCLYVKENSPKDSYEAIKKVLNLNKTEFNAIRTKAIHVSQQNTFEKAYNRLEEIVERTLNINS
jgi:glycosyltransferase involved in cell wall biosynthesis